MSLKAVGNGSNTFLVAAMYVVAASEVAQGLRVKSFDAVSSTDPETPWGHYTSCTKAIEEITEVLKGEDRDVWGSRYFWLQDSKTRKRLVTIRKVGQKGVEVTNE